MTIQEIQKEVTKHMDTFRDRLPKFELYSGVLTETTRIGDDPTGKGKIVVCFAPRLENNPGSGEMNEHVNRPIPAGFIRLVADNYENDCLETIIKKVDYMKDLLLPTE